MTQQKERWLKLLSPERLGAATEHAVGHSPIGAVSSRITTVSFLPRPCVDSKIRRRFSRWLRAIMSVLV